MVFSLKFGLSYNILEKKCSDCKKNLPLNKFRFSNISKSIRHHKCNNCNQNYNKTIVFRNSCFIYNYLLEHPCVDCGESNPIVLEFDHDKNNKKEKDISRLISSKCSLDKIVKEIEKCSVRCANCHRIKTMKEGNHIRYRLCNENLEVVRLDKETLSRSREEIKKAAMELVFDKFDGLLKNLPED